MLECEHKSEAGGRRRSKLVGRATGMSREEWEARFAIFAVFLGYGAIVFYVRSLLDGARYPKSVTCCVVPL